VHRLSVVSQPKQPYFPDDQGRLLLELLPEAEHLRGQQQLLASG
jgi:hypothetical protein